METNWELSQLASVQLCEESLRIILSQQQQIQSLLMQQVGLKSSAAEAAQGPHTRTKDIRSSKEKQVQESIQRTGADDGEEEDEDDDPDFSPSLMKSSTGKSRRARHNCAPYQTSLFDRGLLCMRLMLTHNK